MLAVQRVLTRRVEVVLLQRVDAVPDLERVPVVVGNRNLDHVSGVLDDQLVVGIPELQRRATARHGSADVHRRLTRTCQTLLERGIEVPQFPGPMADAGLWFQAVAATAQPATTRNASVAPVATRASIRLFIESSPLACSSAPLRRESACLPHVTQNVTLRWRIRANRDYSPDLRTRITTGGSSPDSPRRLHRTQEVSSSSLACFHGETRLNRRVFSFSCARSRWAGTDNQRSTGAAMISTRCTLVARTSLGSLYP